MEVQGLAKTFGGLSVLAGVDFSLEAGETRCIIGPNGCGKTTLFNVITGAFAPSAGRVFFRGEDITALRPHDIARRGIARKFQVPGIYAALSVAENLELPSLGKQGLLGLLAAGAAVAAPRGESFLQLPLEQRAGNLAHGQKQWLEIAMLLRGEAQLLLLDEPTAGMTAAETAATAELIRSIQRERGVAVLAIEHDMSFVRQLDCPVIVMLRGKVHFSGSYAEAQRDPVLREAYFGAVSTC